jgi:two-component system OmpR family response regulator
MSKVLIIEDDLALTKVVKKWLAAEKYTVDTAKTGTEGLELLLACPYDIVILDWQLPGLDGLQLCRQYRASGGIAAVLMLTIKGQTTDKTTGLDSGADDYLAKPFELSELSARMRALLRRSDARKLPFLEANGIRLEPASQSVTKNGNPVQLTPKEFAILELLMRFSNQLLTTEAIVNRAWSSYSDTSPENVRFYIKKLRAKLDDDDSDPLIQNVWGKGYILKKK